jgi:hypothetical protein
VTITQRSALHPRLLGLWHSPLRAALQRGAKAFCKLAAAVAHGQAGAPSGNGYGNYNPLFKIIIYIQCKLEERVGFEKATYLFAK